MTQTQAILEHMRKRGSITPVLALKLYGSFRLGARIYDLKRAGHCINSALISRNGKRYSAYSLVE